MSNVTNQIRQASGINATQTRVEQEIRSAKYRVGSKVQGFLPGLVSRLIAMVKGR